MKILTALTALALMSAPALAQVQGRYLVEGRSEGSGYTGTATVSKTGDTYRVEWRVGDERYSGTAIGDDNFLAVSFTSSGKGGVALMTREGPNWQGVWTFNGGRALEREQWVPAPR